MSYYIDFVCIANLLFIDQVHDQLHHHFFFFWIRLSNEESKSCESCVIDLYFTIFFESVTVLLEEPDKEKCSDPLVAIGEWMILDDEIEEMSCLLLDRRIEILSVESSDDI
jgi:hypothetical protein